MERVESEPSLLKTAPFSGPAVGTRAPAQRPVHLRASRPVYRIGGTRGTAGETLSPRSTRLQNAPLRRSLRQSIPCSQARRSEAPPFEGTQAPIRPGATPAPKPGSKRGSSDLHGGTASPIELVGEKPKITMPFPPGHPQDLPQRPVIVESQQVNLPLQLRPPPKKLAQEE